MAAYYHSVSQLSTSNDSWIMRVRVARTWFVPKQIAENVQYSMEIVFIDQRGDKISATVPRYALDKFRSLIKEGCIYVISNFYLTENIGSYRATMLPYKINMTNDTTVQLDHTFIFPVNIFSFTPPPQIFGADYNTDYLADIIGVLTTVGEELTNGSNTNRSRKVDIELDSYGFRFRCTLFGQYVDQLHSFLSTGCSNVVVALMFTKVKSCGGVNVIQTTRESSRLIFNPNIREATQLRNSLAEKTSPHIVPSFNQTIDDRWTNLYEDFIIKATRSNIAQLGFYEVINSVAVLGTIDEVIANHGWWYTNCSCGRTVSHEQNSFFCNYCNHYVVNIIPRYKINVRVVDDSGASNFVIFDNVATLMLNINCAQLVEAAANEFVPQQILDLAGMEFLFKVQVKRDIHSTSSNESNQMYRVIDLTNDSEIVDLFKGHTTHKETAEQKYQMHDDVVFDIRELLDSNNIPQDPNMLEHDIVVESAFHPDELLNTYISEDLQANYLNNSYELDSLDGYTASGWWDNMNVDMSDSSDESVTSPMSKHYK